MSVRSGGGLYNSHSQSHSGVYSGVANLFSNIVGAAAIAKNIVAFFFFCAGTITESCGMLCMKTKYASVNTGTIYDGQTTVRLMPS